MRVAALDLGTNSTRLLIADVEDGRLSEVERRTEVTRLGEGVDRSGELSAAAMERVHTALASYREMIDRHGAERIAAVATSAVRDARNGEAFRASLRERHGIDARTIPGEEEARLTFLGATTGREDTDPVLVLDIGGGSTEVVIGVPGEEPGFHVSTQAGSVRQTERHIESDPPRAGELRALRAEAARILREGVPEPERRRARAGIAVAGTPTSLAAIDQGLDPYDPDRVHGYAVTRDAAERILARLASLPLAERRRIPGLHPGRAPTIVGGAAILCEAMEAFGLDRMEASERDILHGAARGAAS